MAFQWKERYKLGIPEIDAQHKKLFEIGNRAYDIAMSEDRFDLYDDIMAIIDELLDYTRYHFEYEEKLMEKYSYSNINNQIIEHNFYINKISSISPNEIDDNQQKTILEILDFLSQWISTHILFSDRRYADEFREKGIFLG
ncbi:MAG: hemerythrin family protein [Clostridiaceae bacterium]|nr:hemerythrin family protein [Clostridiaceae bacterium]